MTSRRFDELLARSSVGRGLQNIRRNGIEAELAELERDIKPGNMRRRRAAKVKSPLAHPLAHMLTPSLSCEVVEGAITNRIRVLGTRGRDVGAAGSGGRTAPTPRRANRRWRRIDRETRRTR